MRNLKSDLAAKELKEDVEKLLEQSFMAEASTSVWDQFEEALKELDSESQHLLRRFLTGTSLKRISEEKNISEKVAAEWIKKAKREMIEHLRRRFRVRQ